VRGVASRGPTDEHDARVGKKMVECGIDALNINQLLTVLEMDSW
jgi:hypothetical protein